jgi:hypothetical protein
MRRRRHVLQVSTFPFLAVLLCTMGSLILLLLVIDRRAKAVARFKVSQAAAESLRANAPPEKVQEDEWAEARLRLHAALEQEIQDARGHIEQLHAQGGATAAKIEGEQTQIHDLNKRLEGEKQRYAHILQSVTARKEELAKTGKEDQATEQLRRQLTADLANLEQTLAELQLLRKREQRTFSLVPYKGRRGDTRRPIYLECTATGWILHPDLKTLSGIGEGMKALREELERRLSASAGGKESTPYVFLLVRPDGITSFYRAQAAMQGLQVDYGYEFVDASWILDFTEKPEAAQPWMTANSTTPGSAASPSAPKSPKKSVSQGVPGSSATPGVVLGPATTQGTDGSISAGISSSRPGSPGTGSGHQGSSGTVAGGYGSGAPGLSTGGSGGPFNFGPENGPTPGIRGNGQIGSGTANSGSASPTDSGPSIHPSKGVNFSSPAGSAVVGTGSPSLVAGGGSGGFSAPGSADIGGNGGSSSSTGGSGTGTIAHPGGVGSGTGSSPGLPSLEAGGGGSAIPQARDNSGNRGSYSPGGGTGTGTLAQQGVSGSGTDISPGLPSLDGGKSTATSAPSGNGVNLPSRLTGSGSEVGNPGPTSGNPSSSGTTGGDSSAPSGTQGGSPSGPEQPTSPLGQPMAPYPGVSSGAAGGSAIGGSVGGAGAPPGTASGSGTARSGAPGGASGGDSAQDPTDEKGQESVIESPLQRLPKRSTAKPRATTPRPIRLTGNRDWVIPLECTADAIVLPTGVKITAQALSAGDSGAKALLQGVQELIKRKQATVRDGEPEYRPQVRFLVHPEGLRLYHLAYPTLEPLQIPILRQNVEPDDPHQPAKGVRRP